MRKGKIDGKIVEIISVEEYYSNPGLYSYNNTAIDGGDGYVYPIRSKMDCRPGFYMTPTSKFIKQKSPGPEEAASYSDENIIKFDNAESMKELISMQNELQDQERTILTSVDNIFMPPIKEDDSSEMVGMKQAIRAKQCDIDKYSHRLGNNFQNEKRLFERRSMTLSKIRTVCEALDIRCVMQLSDAAPDVPNPMGTVINIDITGQGEGGEE